MLQRWCLLVCLALWLLLLASHPVGAGPATTLNNSRVTAAEVAQAIRQSPTASSQLKAMADAIGSLALFESGGRLTVYNGSCCYGVLQMNRRNISATTPLTPEQYRLLPLQAQVNAWATIMSDALTDPVLQRLGRMTSFDGRPVDAPLLLACVQLGQGNCQRMLRAGRCDGFADLNGTTICSMANRIAGGATSTAATASTQAQGDDMALGSTRPTTGHGGRYTGTPRESCITDGHGHCAPIQQALADGFAAGSGVTMARLRAVIQAIAIATALLIFGSALVQMGRNFMAGRGATVELLAGVRATVTAAGVFAVIVTVV